ncbi:putative glutamine synthetase [Zopfochytrium polystomum]|nr:putative glutamine synthetase [Zopfochytrium polystomum]
MATTTTKTDDAVDALVPAFASHVKLSGCDIDGISRGKLVNRSKFLKTTDQEFGFCNVVFGWDSHDLTYDTKDVPLEDGGYPDIIAKADLSSARKLAWEDDLPLFLVDFYDPKTSKPLPHCPRSLLKRMVALGAELGVKAGVGIEYEFYNFSETPETIAKKKGTDLTPLTPGMFGYSLTRTHVNKGYFLEILNTCNKMNVQLEGYHTETGPGVYEVAIQYNDPVSLADQAHLFKTITKCVGVNHKVTPTFMAKPHNNLPGCSGHIHISLGGLLSGPKNMFVRPNPDIPPSGDDWWDQPLAEGEQLVSKHVTSLLRWFLAGVLEGLPSVMAIFAPTVNSYKRLVENYWAPVTVSYGIENRTAAIRLITPPTCSPAATRLEIRVPGADANPYLAVAAIMACGLEGVKRKMTLTLPPSTGEDAMTNKRLARDLKDAYEEMGKEGSFARTVLGDGFVDHFVGTRRHEWGIWARAVTNWELMRYLETV